MLKYVCVIVLSFILCLLCWLFQIVLTFLVKVVPLSVEYLVFTVVFDVQ